VRFGAGCPSTILWMVALPGSGRNLGGGLPVFGFTAGSVIACELFVHQGAPGGEHGSHI